MHRLNKIGTIFLAGILAVSTLGLGGCTSSEFTTDLDLIAPAVINVLEIIALFKGTPIDTSIPTKISADVAAIEKLYNDFQAATAGQKPSVQTELNAAFAVLNTDIGTVLNLTQVSDLATQAKLVALVGLIETSIQIAEAFVTPTAAVSTTKYKLTDKQLISSYNSTLTSRTGYKSIDDYTQSHQLHIHGSLIRHLTFGVAK